MQKSAFFLQNNMKRMLEPTETIEKGLNADISAKYLSTLFVSKTNGVQRIVEAKGGTTKYETEF